MNLPSNQSRVAVFDRDSGYSGQVARTVRGARLLMLRWLTGQRRVSGAVLDAAGWAAILAAVIVGSHPGRGEVVQIIFATTMIISAMGETLLSPALPVITDDRAAPGAAGRYKRLGTLAFVTGCMLGPSAVGTALGAGWGTSLLTTLAVGCALASVAAHRRRRQPALGAMRSHEPPCPSAGHTARMAARVIASHPEQGWSLLCNGIVLFDDGGLLLPDGRAEAPGPISLTVTST